MIASQIVLYVILFKLAVLILPGGLICDGLHHVPMLGDLAILVKAEDVKGDLLTGTGAVCQIVLDVAIS